MFSVSHVYYLIFNTIFSTFTYEEIKASKLLNTLLNVIPLVSGELGCKPGLCYAVPGTSAGPPLLLMDISANLVSTVGRHHSLTCSDSLPPLNQSDMAYHFSVSVLLKDLEKETQE